MILRASWETPREALNTNVIVRVGKRLLFFRLGAMRAGGVRKRGGCSSSSSSCLAFEANQYWHVQLGLLYKNTGSKAYGKSIPDFVVDDDGIVVLRTGPGNYSQRQ